MTKKLIFFSFFGLLFLAGCGNKLQTTINPVVQELIFLEETLSPDT